MAKSTRPDTRNRGKKPLDDGEMQALKRSRTAKRKAAVLAKLARYPDWDNPDSKQHAEHLAARKHILGKRAAQGLGLGGDEKPKADDKKPAGDKKPADDKKKK